jgi:hypothetical protein
VLDEDEDALGALGMDGKVLVRLDINQHLRRKCSSTCCSHSKQKHQTKEKREAERKIFPFFGGKGVELGTDHLCTVAFDLELIGGEKGANKKL